MPPSSDRIATIRVPVPAVVWPRRISFIGRPFRRFVSGRHSDGKPAGPNDRGGDLSLGSPKIRGLTRSAEQGVPGGHAWTPVGGCRHALPAARPAAMTDSAATTLAGSAPRPVAGVLTMCLAVAGLAIIAAGVWLPWHSPLPDPDPVAALEIAGVAIASLLWLAAALWFRAKGRSRRLWLVLFAMVPASWVWAIGYTATPLTYSIGDTFWGLGVPFAIHMLIAFPNGRLEGRIDRWVVALLYLLFIGGWLLRAMTSPAVYNCDPFCGRNVFAVWPDEALHQVVLTTLNSAILILAIPIAIALWQHWRAASPAARRAFLPAILAIPVNAVIAVISTLAIAYRLDIGWVADHGFKIAVGGLIPAGLLVGLVQVRLERARAASLLVELGHGVPPAGLREALARAVRDPTLELAFPAPDGSGLMDPSGQPFRQPAAGANARSRGSNVAGGSLQSWSTTRRSMLRIRGWSKPWARPRGWRSKTPAWQPRCAPSSRRSGHRGPASPRPRTRSDDGSSGTSTTGPSSDSSR